MKESSRRQQRGLEGAWEVGDPARVYGSLHGRPADAREWSYKSCLCRARASPSQVRPWRPASPSSSPAASVMTIKVAR